MIKTISLIVGIILVASLSGCKNTATAVGETAKGAVHGAGEIIVGVGEGINNVGQGMKQDINKDDGESAE
jgi:hypothetical protein